MRAVVYEEYGAPEVLHLEEVAAPVVGAAEVRVKVRASSVTTGDCNVRGFVFVPDGFRLITRLAMGLRKPRQPILGIEFAGEVDAIGSEVTTFKVGDAVFGISDKMKAYADYLCVPEASGIVHKPANLSYEEAAVIPNGSLTALTFLRDFAHIQAGEDVLINGASGSVGSAAIQIAAHYGASVTGVCSTANVDLVRSLGADTVIDYTQEDFTQRHATYDIILDAVGKSSFAACKPLLNPNGRYLASAGSLKEFWQMLWTSLRGDKKVLAGISSTSKDDLMLIKEMVEAEVLRPVIDKTYALENIVAAHRYVDKGHKKGNVAIRL